MDVRLPGFWIFLVKIDKNIKTTDLPKRTTNEIKKDKNRMDKYWHYLMRITENNGVKMSTLRISMRLSR